MVSPGVWPPPTMMATLSCSRIDVLLSELMPPAPRGTRSLPTLRQSSAGWRGNAARRGACRSSGEQSEWRRGQVERHCAISCEPVHAEDVGVRLDLRAGERDGVSCLQPSSAPDSAGAPSVTVARRPAPRFAMRTTHPLFDDRGRLLADVKLRPGAAHAALFEVEPMSAAPFLESYFGDGGRVVFLGAHVAAMRCMLDASVLDGAPPLAPDRRRGAPRSRGPDGLMQSGPSTGAHSGPSHHPRRPGVLA